jgi:ferritin-like metal-binding protein YciE
MAKTASFDELLTVCIQDLYAAEVMLRDTLPGVSKHANSPKLATLFDRILAEAGIAVEMLIATGRHAGGDDNLWMAGICKDMRRDTRSIERGPLLDAAMIGAVRKAKAAQIMSYDTAIAVAAALRQAAIGEALRAIRTSAVGSNRTLANRLPLPT